ncbi:MAG: acyl carrier protein [Haliea sp.]|nr:MAG: acyl carrier protein [Haliea sp.]
MVQAYPRNHRQGLALDVVIEEIHQVARVPGLRVRLGNGHRAGEFPFQLLDIQIARHKAEYFSSRLTIRPAPTSCSNTSIVCRLAMTDVRELIASILQVNADSLAEDDGPETIAAWDSLKTILLASMVEINYGITLSNRDIEEFTSVGAVREIVARHGAR